VIDKSNCWAYFDGASQNNSQVSGGGGVLYLKDTHFLKYKETFGRGTNNVAEFMALKITLMLVVEYGAIKLQVFGDSLMVINWMLGVCVVENFLLRPIYEELQRLKYLFTTLSFSHVYREHNIEADRLSKEGLLLEPGKWIIEEVVEGNSTIFEHAPFL
jgi:ribonuclease HI